MYKTKFWRANWGRLLAQAHRTWIYRLAIEGFFGILRFSCNWSLGFVDHMSVEAMVIRCAGSEEEEK